MKDIAGNMLFVGDKVAMCVPSYKYLVVGTIVKVNPKSVTVEYIWERKNKTTIRFSDQLVKI